MESEWLREALRFSLKATVYTSSTDDDKWPPQQRDPKFQKLVEGISHTKRFVPTYNLVILGALVVFGVAHWSGEAARWRRRRAARLKNAGFVRASDGDADSIRKNDGEFDGTDSSGTSTLDGTVNPMGKDIDEDEEAPLLRRGDEIQHRGSILSYFKSFLMYQPRPIPFLNKILPSNGISIAVLGLLGLNIFYSFSHINFTLFELFVLADRFGAIFVANLPLLYLLAAKNQPFKIFTGCS